MKEVTLSKGYVAQVDNEDFERISQHKWHAGVDVRNDGSTKNVYARRSIILENGTKTSQYLHCFIMGIVGIDHVDHNGLNNQKENLRAATNTQNQHNAKVRIDNTSGYKGVFWNKLAGKWEAKITTDGSTMHIGLFSILTEAVDAHDAAALLYHKEFALTNAAMPK